MTGTGKHTTYKHGDDWGRDYYCLPTLHCKKYQQLQKKNISAGFLMFCCGLEGRDFVRISGKCHCIVHILPFIEKIR